MEIIKKKFGQKDGSEILLYTLKNDHGMEVSVMNYGATVVSLYLPDAMGGRRNVICGFDELAGYLSPAFLGNAPYFGATIGRYCATIRPASYEGHALAANAGGNCLHGGIQGFDKKIWEARPETPSENECAVVFELLSPDGDQGFPGNVKATVRLSLDNENALSFRYTGETDARTPFSMTNHLYFNLSGFRENVTGHVVRVQSSKVLPLDACRSVREDVRDVAGTCEDLREPKMVSRVHQALGQGIENFYLFDKGMTAEPQVVARIAHPLTGSAVTVSTTEAGMLFYTAKYTSDQLQRNGKEKYGKYCGFCCETHRTPNGPNLPDAENVFLEPGDLFQSETVFKFEF